MEALELAAEVMTLLARCNERLGQIALMAGSLPGVMSVSNRLELRDYRSGPLMEGFVDAELADGSARSIWLQVAWSSRVWTLESSLLAVDNGGRQEVLREFPREEIGAFQELEPILMNALQRLEESIEALFQ